MKGVGTFKDPRRQYLECHCGGELPSPEDRTWDLRKAPIPGPSVLFLSSQDRRSPGN